MKIISPACVLVVLVAISGTSAAQITLQNLAGGALNPYVTVSGSPGLPNAGLAFTVDTVNQRLGAGCIDRAAANADVSYIPCGFGVNPAAGFTIQFWVYRLVAGNLDHLFADAMMMAPASVTMGSGGAFRCFLNGPAGNGNLGIRGVPTQLLTTGGSIGLNTWVHVAVKYEPPPSDVLKCLINGVVTDSVSQSAVPFTWTGSNLVLAGGNNSSTLTTHLRFDDLRVYGFARADGDIAADYLSAAANVGPSGFANLPDRAYFDGDAAIQPHTVRVGTNGDALGGGCRLVTGGTPLQWDGDSPAGDLPASAILDIFGPSTGGPAVNPYFFAYRTLPLPPSFGTQGVPGLQLGHGYSYPAYPLAIIWPDGLGLGAFPGLALLALPGPYTYTSSPPAGLVLPPGILTHGDHIQLQFIAPDSSYPFGIGVSPRAGFVYSDCATVNPGMHAHLEARGNNSTQTQTFWEIHNTGTVDITRVIIDASTCASQGGMALGFNPAGTLGSGGTLAAGTSFRLGTPAYTGLQGMPPGFTAIPAGSALPNAILFDFTSFTACTDELIFDCASDPPNLSGTGYVGATVTLTFLGGVTLTGLLAPDPAGSPAAVLNL